MTGMTEEREKELREWFVKGTTPAALVVNECLDAIAAQRAEIACLRTVHESELGVCQQHCDVVAERDAEIARLRAVVDAAREFHGPSVRIGMELEHCCICQAIVALDAGEARE